mmetsp:Transcript_11945/g.13873  ORF Transcript_11945/g.13873 Transcript_11945/m.13873 type:complete len:181 (+) Transcript_11945:512-1054(+)
MNTLTLFCIHCSMDEAREKLFLEGDNLIPNPNKDCPRWLCCLLPCLNNTQAMVAYRACEPDAAYVVRDGDELCVDADGLVVGDVVTLKPGTIVPADVIIFDCTENFTVTCFDKRGVHIQCKPLSPQTTKDLHNLCFAGCMVLRGNAKGIVINTGENTLMAYLIDNKHWPLSQKAKSMSTV